MGWLEETIKFICAALYFIPLNLFNKEPRRVVIYYHCVKKQDVKDFQKHMEYLARKCTVVKPSTIKAAPVNGTNPLVAITFDDAFVNVMENAIPILKMYNLPAGISVPIGNLGQPPSWETPDGCSGKNETIMSKDQVAELDKDGFEIFSHTMSHHILTKIDSDRLESELKNSKRILERIIGHEVRGIIYPHGVHDGKVCEAAQKIGYRLGFNIEPYLVDSKTDDMMIGRFSVSPQDSIFKFRLKINGAYALTRYLKSLKRLFQRID